MLEDHLYGYILYRWSSFFMQRSLFEHFLIALKVPSKICYNCIIKLDTRGDYFGEKKIQAIPI